MCMCVCVCVCVCTVLCCLIRGSPVFVNCFLVLCHYCLENRVICDGALVIYVSSRSGSLDNLLFFYGDYIFPFVSDMWHVRGAFYCVMCSVVMGVRISIFFLVDLQLFC